LLKRYLAKEAALDGEGSRWINQIHRDDAARALFHLYAHRCAPGIYNVADDQPATQRDVYQWIADFLGGALPAPAQGDVVRRRGASNKRVSNAKLKAVGWTPLFPAYRVALPDLVRAEE
jgi:nucleoside-diphosphate-sugar epimerase